MIKRLICFLVLLTCLSFSAFALPDVYDKTVGPREYQDSLDIMQTEHYISNNNVTFAFLHWVASPENHSVYLGLQYHCKDHAVEDGMTGVKVFINDELICTVFGDGTIEGVDKTWFEIEVCLDDGTWGPPYDSTCEIRVGIKPWPKGDIVAGIQIIDFSGDTSNYYEQLVYSPYTTTTQPDEPTASQKAATEKSTTAKTTTTKTTTTKTTTAKSTAAASAEQTAQSARTTVPIITASPSRESTATTAAHTTQAAVVRTEKAVAQKTTKAKTTKAKTTKRAKTTEPSATETLIETSAVAAVLPATTEAAETTAATTAADDTPSNAQMYSELNKVKIVGTVLVVVILTAAIMSSIFLGMRQKQEPAESRTPQEEYDDFG